MNPSYYCPYCGSHDQYFKVSALQDVETSQINTTTKGIGIGVSGSGMGVGVGAGKTGGTIQSNLAAKLAPPETPELFMSGCGVAGAWIAGFAVLGLAVGLYFLLGEFNEDFEDAGIGWKGWLGVGALGLVGLYFIIFRKSIARADEETQAKYENEKAAWERRWYCKKCGEFSEEVP